jgi:hypothetical protein
MMHAEAIPYARGEIFLRVEGGIQGKKLDYLIQYYHT